MMDCSNILYFLRKCGKYECRKLLKDLQSPFNCDDSIDNGSLEEPGLGKLQKMSALSTNCAIYPKESQQFKRKIVAIHPQS